MSATTAFSTTAKTPFSEAASLEHYNSKTLNELKVLAKLHGVPDAASDKNSNTWPGMHKTKTDVVDTKKDGGDSAVAPIKQASWKDETPLEIKATPAGKGRSNNASTAAVSNNSTTATWTTGVTAKGFLNGDAIPMSQLAKEWDGLWGPPFAFAKAATVDSNSQGTSVTTAGSPTRSKSPVSPASLAPSAASASSKSNRYDVLVAEEKEIGEPEEIIEVAEEEISAANNDMERAPSVHQEWVAVSTIQQEEGDEEKEALAKINADASEKTKKKKKRGKKGGKKVNKAKIEAAQSAEAETDTINASTSDAAAALKRASDTPLPVSPAKSESTETTIEPTVDLSGPILIVEENDGTIVEPSSSVAPTEMDESVDDQIDLVESEPTENAQGPSLAAQTPASKQTTDFSLVATPPEPPVQPPTKAPAQIAPVASPLPPPSTQAASAATPTMTKNQRRNEKRKESKQVISSNMYNALFPDQSADASAPNSSNTKEDNNGNSGEGAAPAAKKYKRGTKGGKKAQAQKKKHLVPVVETTAASVVLAATAAKIEPIHVALVVAVAILAGALGAWVKG